MKRLLYILIIVIFTSCTSKKHYDVDRNTFPVKGIDVSAHNGVIDYHKAWADSITFVYIKATEGTDFCDVMFERNLKGASSAQLKVGAYHFFRFDSPGHLQAYNLLSAVKDFDLDLPLAIDVEEWTNDENIPTAEVVQQLQSMVSVLQAAGHKVIIYTNHNGYLRYISGFFPDIELWMSSLEGLPRAEWTLWQHSHTGKVLGINGNVDIDTFNGDLVRFNNWLAQ